jgi:hypothetical protein
MDLLGDTSKNAVVSAFIRTDWELWFKIDDFFSQIDWSQV